MQWQSVKKYCNSFIQVFAGAKKKYKLAKNRT